MKLHLDYTPKKSPFNIDHRSKILLAGSCFSDNIGNLLINQLFNAKVNPEGLFFNPASLCESLEGIISNKAVEKDLILKRDNIVVSYLHHSRIQAQSPEDFISMATESRIQTHQFLKQADVLIITFGTAFVYSLKEANRMVANCHKQPSPLFDKRILSVNEISEMYRNLIGRFQGFNKNLKIIFTISPVKYLKDGVEENTLSKATLRLAVNEIINDHKNCSYFPAYELISDDLRDYRFYKEDMAHPNEQAIQYVWRKFSDCFFSEETIKQNLLNEKENRQKAHRSLNK